MEQSFLFDLMENEGKSNRVRETDFLLQWGNRKRLRCLKVKEEESNGVIKKRITSRVDRRVVRTDKEKEKEKEKELPSVVHNSHKNFGGDGGMKQRARSSENLKSQQQQQQRSSSSPEKEERYYTTRGSVGVDENGKNLMMMDHNNHVGVEEKKGVVWPKLFLSLSNKEKEEDFMAMKGCKPPQRPKKRAKFIQKTLLLVSPGAWLSDLCQERYEVREKKTSKKRPRGLKAMGSMESDSE